MSNITLSAEKLQELIAAAVATAMATHVPAKPNTLVDGKTERSLKNEILAVKAFKKAGFGDIKPHQDVKTYNRWLAEGRKVKQGEHGTKVKNLRLFHVTQTVAISGDEKTEALAKMQEAIAKYNAKKNGDKPAPSKPATVTELHPNQG